MAFLALLLILLTVKLLSAAPPEKTITGSVGEACELTFAPGQCSLKDPWSIMKHPGQEDIFGCRNRSPHFKSNRFNTSCPVMQEKNIPFQISPLEISDSGTYCLQEKEKNCSCVHLDVRSISSVNTSGQSNRTAPDLKNVSNVNTSGQTNSTAPVNLEPWFIGVAVVAGLIRLMTWGIWLWNGWKEEQKQQQPGGGATAAGGGAAGAEGRAFLSEAECNV